jgi:hypothetical protein
MQKNFTLVAVSIFGTAATSMATLPTPSLATNLDQQVQTYIQQGKIQETATKEAASPKPKRLICKDCNSNEKFVLDALQEGGITDKNAIATVMGNIRQESMFIPDICEGGGRVPYHRCYSGGVGILQWTDSTRFYGLGRFAKAINGDPSTLDTQVKYMFSEPDWKMIKDRMSQPGGTVNDYMRLAFKWIRWGIHGARTSYSYDYVRRLEFDS